MNESTRIVLNKVAAEYGTPSYVYFLDSLLRRITDVRRAFEGRFTISYAVKSNPNRELLRWISPRVGELDVSSIGELERGLQSGQPAEKMTFSGPAKRVAELERAVAVGCGRLVCESEWEIEQLNRLSQELHRTTSFLIRINPSRMPRYFGVNMAGKPTQFGIDEENVEAVLDRLGEWDMLCFEGFHIYSGTNCLREKAIAENFGVFADLFSRFSESHHLQPRKLIFGSGFGIPYYNEQRPLDLAKLAGLVNPLIDRMRRNPRLARAECTLEMGRYLVGPEGYLLTAVVNEKLSRGTKIRMCDAGFNNHLAAFGMMGMIIRRNWRIEKVNIRGDEPKGNYLLTGPLCTTIDIMASRIELPELHRGDILAIGSSGAYGLTASPTRFISHPEPREFLVTGPSEEARIMEVTESTENSIAV